MALGRVAVIGSVAFDAIEGPSGSVRGILGGSATYASFAASVFSPASIIACVGMDFPEESMRTLSERGIDLSGLKRMEGKTFRWSGRYGPGFRSRETLSLDLGVFSSFDPEITKPLSSDDVLLLGNIDPDLQLKVLDRAGRNAYVAADTIDHWIRGKRDSLLKGLERTHLFFLNDEEAELLTGESNMICAGKKIMKMGPRNVVVKKGAHGALLFGERGVAALPALPLEEVVDPTGAGDVFAGAMLGWMAGSGGRDEASLRRAMAYGVVLSSFVVEHFGVERLRALGAQDVEDRLNRLRELVSF